MKHLGLFALSTLALLGAPTLIRAQEAVELKPRWVPGKTYHQTVKMEQGTKMEIGGQKIEQKMGTQVETTTSVAADAATKQTRLTQKFGRIAMQMDMMGQKMEFDSNKPDAADPLGLGKVLGAMAGKELRMVLDEQGKVASIENLEEVLKPLGESNPMVGEMMKSMFSKETLAQQMNQSALKALPGKPVKAGDSWPYKTTTVLPQMGEISMKGAYTVKGFAQRGGAKCVELAEEGTLAMNMEAAGTEGAAANPVAKLGMKVENGTLKGTTWFDAALGMAREAQFTQSMTLKMNNPVQADATIEVPVQQTITVTLTGVDGK